MTMLKCFLHNCLCCLPLIEKQHHTQKTVKTGFFALLLHPDVQQLMDPVLVEKMVPTFDHVVRNAKVAEEPPVVVHLHLFEKLETFFQRFHTCSQKLSHFVK